MVMVDLLQSDNVFGIEFEDFFNTPFPLSNCFVPMIFESFPGFSNISWGEFFEDGDCVSIEIEFPEKDVLVAISNVDVSPFVFANAALRISSS